MPNWKLLSIISFVLLLITGASLAFCATPVKVRSFPSMNSNNPLKLESKPIIYKNITHSNCNLESSEKVEKVAANSFADQLNKHKFNLPGAIEIAPTGQIGDFFSNICLLNWNIDETARADSSRTIPTLQRWGIPIGLTIGTGAVIYSIYSVRGR